MWLLITSTHLSLIFDSFTFHTQGKLKYAMPLLTGTLYTCLFLPEAFSLPLPFFLYLSASFPSGVRSFPMSGSYSWSLTPRLHCNQIQVWPLATQQPINRGASFDREARYFIQKSRWSGETVGLYPENNSKDSAPWQFLKGKKGIPSQLIIKAGGHILHHFSITCRPADFSPSQDAVLPIWSAWKFTKGKLGVESQSFFNYLVFHPYTFCCRNGVKGLGKVLYIFRKTEIRS